MVKNCLDGHFFLIGRLKVDWITKVHLHRHTPSKARCLHTLFLLRVLGDFGDFFDLFLIFDMLECIHEHDEKIIDMMLLKWAPGE